MKYEHIGELILCGIAWIFWVKALLLTIGHTSIEMIPPFAILTALMAIKTVQTVKQIIDCNKEDDKNDYA